MLTINRKTDKNLKKRIITTSLFCLLISFLTYTLWPGDYHIHLLISFGYGYSAQLSVFILQNLLPRLTLLKYNLVALLSAIILGNLNASYWLSRYENFSSLASMAPVGFLALIFSVICFYVFHSNQQKVLAEKALEVAKRKQSEQEKALILSQLNQLQSQIEPHFLFNTLANIQALIELDTQKANSMLTKLTELLRMTLTTNRASLTNLKQETQLLSAYLDIQEIRLGERLKYQIDNQIKQVISLPPFLLQPLVENAIQHGIEPSAKGGEIIICYQIKAQNLVIDISDSGIGLQENGNSKGNGISLNNIKARLENLFAGEASLSITENHLGGVSSILSIPLTQLNKLQEEQD